MTTRDRTRRNRTRALPTRQQPAPADGLRGPLVCLALGVTLALAGISSGGATAERTVPHEVPPGVVEGAEPEFVPTDFDCAKGADEERNHGFSIYKMEVTPCAEGEALQLKAVQFRAVQFEKVTVEVEELEIARLDRSPSDRTVR